MTFENEGEKRRAEERQAEEALARENTARALKAREEERERASREERARDQEKAREEARVRAAEEKRREAEREREEEREESLREEAREEANRSREEEEERQEEEARDEERQQRDERRRMALISDSPDDLHDNAVFDNGDEGGGVALFGNRRPPVATPAPIKVSSGLEAILGSPGSDWDNLDDSGAVGRSSFPEDSPLPLKGEGSSGSAFPLPTSSLEAPGTKAAQHSTPPRRDSPGRGGIPSPQAPLSDVKSTADSVTSSINFDDSSVDNDELLRMLDQVSSKPYLKPPGGGFLGDSVKPKPQSSGYDPTSRDSLFPRADSPPVSTSGSDAGVPGADPSAASDGASARASPKRSTGLPVWLGGDAGGEQRARRPGRGGGAMSKPVLQ
ncbi:hypothetical protein T484DRAFT_1887723, partial [Baffinella frigidus]